MKFRAYGQLHPAGLFYSRGSSDWSRRDLLGAAAGGLLTATALPALSQTYPVRPISWVVPFAAGGPTDSLARQIADRVSHELGQPIIVENVPGAGGTLAAAKLARSKPDGYSLLVGHIGYMGAAPSLFRKLSYDPVKDFDPVFRLPDTPLVLMVRNNHPAKDIQSLLAMCKAQPNKTSLAHAGVGSVSHLISALFVTSADIKVIMVPYKGTGPAMVDVIGGQVDALFDQANTAMPQIAERKVRALAVTSRTRLPELKDVPTLDETVLPGFEASTWYGVYSAKGTPSTALSTLESAYLKVMRDKAFTDKLAAQGILLLRSDQYTRSALGQHTEAEVLRWRSVAAKTNLAIE